jgi:hypothetical protein
MVPLFSSSWDLVHHELHRAWVSFTHLQEIPQFISWHFCYPFLTKIHSKNKLLSLKLKHFINGLESSVLYIRLFHSYGQFVKLKHASILLIPRDSFVCLIQPVLQRQSVGNLHLVCRFFHSCSPLFLAHGLSLPLTRLDDELNQVSPSRTLYFQTSPYSMQINLKYIIHHTVHPPSHEYWVEVT